MPPEMWTKEKTLEGLRALVSTEAAPPHTWKAYIALKKGHPEWPPVQNVVAHFGSVREAMVLAGADEAALPRDGLPWEPWEDALVLDQTETRVGRGEWPKIAKAVRRSVHTCKRRVWELRKQQEMTDGKAESE